MFPGDVTRSVPRRCHPVGVDSATMTRPQREFLFALYALGVVAGACTIGMFLIGKPVSGAVMLVGIGCLFAGVVKVRRLFGRASQSE